MINFCPSIVRFRQCIEMKCFCTGVRSCWGRRALFLQICRRHACHYSQTTPRAVSSVVEHLVYTERVGGSKPSPPSFLKAKWIVIGDHFSHKSALGEIRRDR